MTDVTKPMCAAQVRQAGQDRPCLLRATQRFAHAGVGDAAVCATHAATLTGDGFGAWVRFPGVGLVYVTPAQTGSWEPV